MNNFRICTIINQTVNIVTKDLVNPDNYVHLMIGFEKSEVIKDQSVICLES